MRALFTFLLLNILNLAYSQEFSLTNETILFSFKTSQEKMVVLAADTADRYMVFRMGTDEKTELEFPENKTESWKKFSYSYYLRGGGADNEGLDLNYVFFTLENKRFVIYSNYSASDDKHLSGLRIIDLSTKNTVVWAGESGSETGSLISLRDNNLITHSDELFD